MDNLPIKGYLGTSLIEWPGKISAVVFLAYCNFRCPFCHNSELVLSPQKLKNIPLDFVFADLQARRKFVDGVAITGGEPTLAKGLKEFVKKLKKEGFGVMIETNGTHPEVIEDFNRQNLVDFWSMDVKAPLRAENYSRVVGVKVDEDLLSKIKKSISLIKEFGEYEFKTTVVPTLLEKRDIIEIAQFLGPVKRYYLQQFRPKNCLDPNFEKIKPYAREYLLQILEEIKRYIPNTMFREE